MTVLWHDDSDGVRIGPVDPDTLPLSERTKADLRDWAARYDATMDHDDPRSSAFPSWRAAETFEADGLRLWQRFRPNWGRDSRSGTIPTWSSGSWIRTGYPRRGR